MAGETNLEALIAGMRPVLRRDVHVFCTLPEGAGMPAGVDPVMIFREAEGMTLILREVEARRAGLEAANFRCRMITLEIHSALEAVGFLAAITARLAAVGMGVNPVSAFFHDHLFVPEDRAEEAMGILISMARSAGDLPPP
ncbi:ACT domain-containing protein [Mesorhizobium sp. LHD-90]|uniref:ACT domain-containing protein n=1 Tax=Mesorhizobium sp. LHD-90 TaxID=3071414 RepID=UPI0027E1B4DD|nr:ACT domain-containing protein [Mesorhizobium sp. LHD-90]MDQ6437774.1 ACT domain-containing protein [Mesorhizobium sp. LHD-90]